MQLRVLVISPFICAHMEAVKDLGARSNAVSFDMFIKNQSSLLSQGVLTHISLESFFWDIAI